MLSDPAGISGWVSVEKHPFLYQTIIFSFKMYTDVVKGFRDSTKIPFWIPFKNCPWVPLGSEAKVSSSGLLNTSVQEGQALSELQTRCLNITFPLLSFLF